jgi:hypothetical protein
MNDTTRTTAEETEGMFPDALRAALWAPWLSFELWLQLKAVEELAEEEFVAENTALRKRNLDMEQRNAQDALLSTASKLANKQLL